jgi:anaerobic C4-dicarboxylate transporter
MQQYLFLLLSIIVVLTAPFESTQYAVPTKTVLHASYIIFWFIIQEHSIISENTNMNPKHTTDNNL